MHAVSRMHTLNIWQKRGVMGVLEFESVTVHLPGNAAWVGRKSPHRCHAAELIRCCCDSGCRYFSFVHALVVSALNFYILAATDTFNDSPSSKACLRARDRP